MILANTNGRLHDALEPSLSPLNRGFLYGDCAYEVWRTVDGVLFGWAEHLDRLDRTAEALFMQLPLGRAELLSEVRRTCAEYRARSGFGGELYVRLQVYRGEGKIGLDTSLAGEPGYVLLVQPCALAAPEALEHGIRLSVARRLRRNPPWACNPAWKTGNYLNNILCLHEARARGADEVVMLNATGEVTEAAVMNIGFVKGDRVVTPPLEAGILAGITRGVLVGPLREGHGWCVEEAPVPEVTLGEWDECFVLSTTKDVLPVASIDGHRYRTDAGTVTRRLREAFQRHAREVCARHPELRV
jgi:branched-chain amino acid aminotransferase